MKKNGHSVEFTESLNDQYEAAQEVEFNEVERLKFVSLYLFGNTCIHNDVQQDFVPYNFGRITEEGWPESFVLELKSLTSITFEDWIEVSKVIYPNFEDTLEKGLEQLAFQGANPFVIQAFTADNDAGAMAFVRMPPHRFIAAIDRLRSMGYLLPWNGYSCDQILSTGIVKLIE